MKVKIKIVKDGVMPLFAHKLDACADCYARLNDTKIIQPNNRLKIPLGFAIQLPKRYEALIRPRSGLSSKGIDCALGTIDFGFKGEVNAIIINNSKEPFEVKPFNRICQMAIRKTKKIKFSIVDKLKDSERGECGFGSTGI